MTLIISSDTPVLYLMIKIIQISLLCGDSVNL